MTYVPTTPEELWPPGRTEPFVCSPALSAPADPHIITLPNRTLPTLLSALALMGAFVFDITRAFAGVAVDCLLVAGVCLVHFILQGLDLTKSRRNKIFIEFDGFYAL